MPAAVSAMPAMAATPATAAKAEYDAWMVEQDGQIKQTTIKLETDQKRAAEVQSKINSLNTEIESIRSERAVKEMALEELRGELANLNHDQAAMNNHIERGARKLEAMDKAAAEHSSIAGQISEVTAQIQAINPKLEVTRQETEQAMTANTEEIDRLEKQKADYLKAKADEQRNAQALIEHAACKAGLEVTQAAIKTLETVQAEMVQAAFAVILRKVNRFTDGIMKSPVEYREGEIGRWEGKTWIRHEVFSGTEKALTYAGISAALAADAPYRIILMDEMGIMDQVSFRNVLKRMIEMTDEGEIDQFVGCTSQDVPNTDRVNLIRL